MLVNSENRDYIWRKLSSNFLTLCRDCTSIPQIRPSQKFAFLTEGASGRRFRGRNVPEAIHSSNKYLLSTYVLGAVLWTKGTKITEIWPLLLRNSQSNEEGGWETVWQVIWWGFAEGILGAHKNSARKDLGTKEKHSVNEQILHKQSITLENISISLWINDPKWSNWNITFREEAEVSKYCSSGLLVFPTPPPPLSHPTHVMVSVFYFQRSLPQKKILKNTLELADFQKQVESKEVVNE